MGGGQGASPGGGGSGEKDSDSWDDLLQGTTAAKPGEEQGNQGRRMKGCDEKLAKAEEGGYQSTAQGGGLVSAATGAAPFPTDMYWKYHWDKEHQRMPTAPPNTVCVGDTCAPTRRHTSREGIVEQWLQVPPAPPAPAGGGGCGAAAMSSADASAAPGSASGRHHRRRRRRQICLRGPRRQKCLRGTHCASGLAPGLGPGPDRLRSPC